MLKNSWKLLLLLLLLVLLLQLHEKVGALLSVTLVQKVDGDGTPEKRIGRWSTSIYIAGINVIAATEAAALHEEGRRQACTSLHAMK